METSEPRCLANEALFGHQTPRLKVRTPSTSVLGIVISICWYDAPRIRVLTEKDVARSGIIVNPSRPSLPYDIVAYPTILEHDPRIRSPWSPEEDLS
jgi:hypothetical protein